MPARDYMRRSGNPNQWEEGYPSRAILEQDLNRGHLYVIRRDAGICGAFVLALGEDPTMAGLTAAAWPRSALMAPSSTD